MLNLCVVKLYLNTEPEKPEFVTKFGPQQLHHFDGIKTTTVFHWNNKEKCSRYAVKMDLFNNQSNGIFNVNCPNTQLHSIVRNNAIPFPDPYNFSKPKSVLDEFLYEGILYKNSTENKSRNLSFTFYFDVMQGPSEIFLSAFLNRVEHKDVKLRALMKTCNYFLTITIYKEKLSTRSTSTVSNSSNKFLKLRRIAKDLFNTEFNTDKLTYKIKSTDFLYFKWRTFVVSDCGGTMLININKIPNYVKSEEATVLVCLSRSKSASVYTGCTLEHSLKKNFTKENITWYIPYPQAGDWFVSFSLLNDTRRYAEIELKVNITNCIENCHEDKSRGNCVWAGNYGIIFSGCNCKAGREGIACTDDSRAMSYKQQVIRTIFLTTSNLIFIPCILISTQRRHYQSAIVYFYSFMASFLYHACDQPGSFSFCILPYGALQFCDFFGSLCALWFTLVLIARTPCNELNQSFNVFGCLLIATLVLYDRFSLITYLFPFLIGTSFMFFSWIFKSRKNKSFLFSKKVILHSLLPGSVLAFFGSLLYALGETKNVYYLTHSAWHVLMAISIVFLLPKETLELKDVSFDFKNNFK